ncbi:MAG: hypothetical protein BMS9Abin26_0553 [Gammaproteobacteria bacterium]|nr:MAG: hypothetical protein BMS9Abin26_0553 [Gammaproteobacteria bacterium]
MRYFIGISVLIHVIVIMAFTESPFVIYNDDPPLQITLIAAKGDARQDELATSKAVDAALERISATDIPAPVRPAVKPAVKSRPRQDNNNLPLAPEHKTPETAVARKSPKEAALTDSENPAVTGPAGAREQDRQKGVIASNSTGENRAQTLRKLLYTALEPHFYYPRLARRNGWQGLVQLGMTIKDSGQLSDIHLLKTSGYPLLDNAALNSIGKIRYLPDAVRWIKEHHFDMVVHVKYQLSDF